MYIYNVSNVKSTACVVAHVYECVQYEYFILLKLYLIVEKSILAFKLVSLPFFQKYNAISKKSILNNRIIFLFSFLKKTPKNGIQMSLKLCKVWFDFMHVLLYRQSIK